MSRVLGIFRERLHSPERESDDEIILRKTGEVCSSLGMNVVLKTPEEFLDSFSLWQKSIPDLLFVMCEQSRILEKISELELAGAQVINKTSAIYNTYRDRMLPLLQNSKVPFPKSQLIWTRGMDLKRILETFPTPCWIKRGDVHNTQKGDVTLVQTQKEIEQSLQSFDQRGIEKAVLQENVPGDLIKFYGIGCGSGKIWFQWFYHKNQDLKHYPFSVEVLTQMTDSAASSLGLEIYGGDAIVTSESKIFLIDLNAWPSFALFREDASKKIAQYLSLQIERVQVS